MTGKVDRPRGKSQAAKIITVSDPCAVLLAIDVSVAGGTAEVVLCGEFDTVTAPGLAEQLGPVLDERPAALVFDMRAVTFIDCAAARVLVQAGRLLPEGVKPVIRSPTPMVRRLLQASCFGGVFKLEAAEKVSGSRGSRAPGSGTTAAAP